MASTWPWTMRGHGLDVTTETCPQYLLLTERDLAERGGEVKCNPPVRPPAEVERLWESLERGDIDLISSDHVGWPAESKFGEDIFSLASGGPGVELLLPLMYDAFVARGLDPARLVQLLCEAPARRFGLWPAKGALLPGADADIVLFDPDAPWSVDPAALTCVAGWSPFRGRALAGRVEAVYLRGEAVVADGRVLGAARSRALRGDRRPAARTPRADGDHGDHHMTADVSLTRYVAEWSTELSADDIPQRTRDIAIRHVLDGYGLALSGHAEESHAILRRYVDSVGADGAVHVLGARPAHVRRARGARQRPRHARNGLRRHAVGDRP